jgi:hypothetical protein
MVTEELTRTVILLGMAVAGSSVLLAKLISKIHGSYKPYMKATILYLFVGLLLFSAIACVAYWSYLKDQHFFYLLYQGYFLLLGILHVNWMQEYLKWAGNSKSLWAEFLFTIIIAMLGSIGFISVFRYFSSYGLEYSMTTSIIFFIVPWFVLQTFLSAISIPARILKEWFYPVSEEIEEPDEDKLKNLLVISFVIQKQIADVHETNFRAKAPVDMEMGELFYYFINDYNERHPQDKIEFINTSGEPYGWVFYKKPHFFDFQKKYINARKTIFNNGIKENNVIICSRSLN